MNRSEINLRIVDARKALIWARESLAEGDDNMADLWLMVAETNTTSVRAAIASAANA